MCNSGEITFQSKGISCASQNYQAWYVQETERRPVWVEQNRLVGKIVQCDFGRS